MESIISVILIALLATAVFCVPEGRLKRSYGSDHGGRNAPPDFGMDSDEHDVSMDHHAPCGLLEDNSGSPEHFDFDDHPDHEPRRGFSVKAAAKASSSSYS